MSVQGVDGGADRTTQLQAGRSVRELSKTVTALSSSSVTQAMDGGVGGQRILQDVVSAMQQCEELRGQGWDSHLDVLSGRLAERFVLLSVMQAIRGGDASAINGLLKGMPAQQLGQVQQELLDFFAPRIAAADEGRAKALAFLGLTFCQTGMFNPDLKANVGGQELNLFELCRSHS